MDLTLTLSDREIRPQVVNLFQYENLTTTLNITLDSYMHGEVDLRNYKAYAVTSQNGLIDMTELAMRYDEVNDELTLSWPLEEYSLRQEGAVLYQISFKETTAAGEVAEGENTAVFNSYKGIIINRGSVDGDNHITANYPTLLKQWLDRINAMNSNLESNISDLTDELNQDITARSEQLSKSITDMQTELTDLINGLAGSYDAGIIYIPYGETLTPEQRLEGRLYFQFTDAENTKGQFEDHNGLVLTDPDVVHKTGNEDINGNKSFLTNVYLRNNDIDINTPPETNKYHSINANDKNGQRFAAFEVEHNINGAFLSRVQANRLIDGEQKYAQVQAEITTDGTCLGRAPTPPAGVSSNEIVTANWINDPSKSTSVVHRSGTETISGSKTFTASPKVPIIGTSSNDTSAANTAWVNNKFKVVSALPASPDPNIFYFIPE